MPRTDSSTLFWAKVDKSGDCWLWTGSRDRDGYGRFSHKGAHRFAYQDAVGPIPPGLQIDHLCRVRHCVNPAHLEAVTNRENTRRSLGLPSSHPNPQRRGIHLERSRDDDGVPVCKNGHRLTPDNCAPIKQRPHLFSCRTCDRNRLRAWKAARRREN